MSKKVICDDLVPVGKYDIRSNDVLGIQLEELQIYRSKGLPAHIIKRKHFNCLKYIDYIPEIIENPDYIGVNPNESGISIELIKGYKDNVMIGIKLDVDGNYLYVSTMHDVQQSKIDRRLHSGRLKKYELDNRKAQ